jgi:hypothetical protein
VQALTKRAAFVTRATTRITIRQLVWRVSKTQIAATLETSVSAGTQQVFNFVVAEDVLPRVLTGYGFLPGVVRTSGNTGPWDQPGSVRTVHLADGTTAREEVTDYDFARHFAYRTSDYTFALRPSVTS